MAKKSKQLDEAKLIRTRIERAQKYFEKENKKKYGKFQDYLKIRHYPEGEEGDKITVAFIHSIIRSKVPAIYLRNPKYLISTKKKHASADPLAIATTYSSKIPCMQAIMDYLPGEIDMEREVKINVLDYVGFGKGVAKVGFEFEMEEPKLIPQVDEMGQPVIDPETGEPIVTQEEAPKILVDRFYVKRVGYPKGDFVWDTDSTTGLRGARWCAEKMVSPLEDIQNNKFFKNTADLKANTKVDNEKFGIKDKKEEDEKLLTYWQYWEKNQYGVVDKYKYVVIDQDVTVIAEGENPYSHGDWPYEDVDNYINPDEVFSIGDIEPLARQQEELDIAETLTFEHAKRFIQKYKAKKGDVDDKAKEALKTPDNAVIELENINSLVPLENPSVNQTLPLTTQTIKDDMTVISGRSEYDRGGDSGVKRTATEALVIQRGSSQRADDALKDIEGFTRRIGRKLMQLVQQYMTEEMVVRISGNGDDPKDWLQVSPEEIQGEFDLDVEPYSTAPINKEIQKKQAMDLYNLYRNDPDLGVEARNELRKYVLEAFDFKNIQPFEVTQEEIMQKRLSELPPEGANPADVIDRGAMGRGAPGITNLMREEI